MKEDVSVLREGLEKWKEVTKKQATWGLETLVGASSQFEILLSIQEKEELLCPKCGVIFQLSAYKIEKVEIAS